MALAARARPTLSAETRPVLARHAKLRFDKTRERWVILVPERVLVPDETAVAILKLCDGERSLAEVAASLAETYAADPEVILADCVALLQDLADKGYLVAAGEGTR
jgi:pyrroloquinoline quinone biosynthesis protein D